MTSRAAPLSPIYSTKRANKTIPLKRARVIVTCGGKSVECPGKAIMRLQPRLRLVVSVDLSNDPSGGLWLMAADGPATIQFGSHSRPTKVFVQNYTSRNGPEESTANADLVPNPEHMTICDDRRARLASVTFHLMNFPAFLSQGEDATDLRYESPSGQLKRLGRALLVNEDWRIELQTLPTADGLIKQLQAEGGYAITHTGRLERTDGRHFWISHAETALRELHDFLSFARGLWAPLVLPVGVDAEGNRVFEEWGNRLATGWEPRISWFDEHNGQSLSELFPGFIHLMRHREWGEPAKGALYWYLRSNRAGEGAGVDSGIILSQAALERLTIAYLASAGLSTAGSATSRLRRASRQLNLPMKIPNAMAALSKARQRGAWSDLPEALVKVRNELVHPKKTLNFNVGKVVSEVWNAAQWYVELYLLRLAGYNGLYSNRLRSRWRGEVERVPWAH